jgi:hypothetical protein
VQAGQDPELDAGLGVQREQVADPLGRSEWLPDACAAA